MLTILPEQEKQKYQYLLQLPENPRTEQQLQYAGGILMQKETRAKNSKSYYKLLTSNELRKSKKNSEIAFNKHTQELEIASDNVIPMSCVI